MNSAIESLTISMGNFINHDITIARTIDRPRKEEASTFGDKEPSTHDFARLRIAGKVVAPKHALLARVDPRVFAATARGIGVSPLDDSQTIFDDEMWLAGVARRERIVAVDFTKRAYPRICATRNTSAV